MSPNTVRGHGHCSPILQSWPRHCPPRSYDRGHDTAPPDLTIDATALLPDLTIEATGTALPDLTIEATALPSPILRSRPRCAVLPCFDDDFDAFLAKVHLEGFVDLIKREFVRDQRGDW
jgi:hypothetical protein